jgi:uncharacterized membrane protein YqhA
VHRPAPVARVVLVEASTDSKPLKIKLLGSIVAIPAIQLLKHAM